jgi:hypothetical protein
MTPFLNTAIRLYEAFGFRRMNDGPHDLFGTPLFTMEKTVALAIEEECRNPNLSNMQKSFSSWEHLGQLPVTL